MQFSVVMDITIQALNKVRYICKFTNFKINSV